MNPEAEANAGEAQGDEIEIFDSEGALSREFLQARGSCCGNGCKNCPYGFRKEGTNR